MVRIIGGVAGGRRLKSFRGPGVRPTTDRVRESWFGMLGERVVGARFLDLYAGTGAVGIEALSRGAGHCVLVEKSRQGTDVIRENLAVLGEFSTRARVLQADAIVALRSLARAADAFDLVFADPPYEDAEAPRRALEALVRSEGLLAPEAWVAIQHSRRTALPEAVGRLRRRVQRRYGDTVVSVYEMSEEKAEAE